MRPDVHAVYNSFWALFATARRYGSRRAKFSCSCRVSPFLSTDMSRYRRRCCSCWSSKQRWAGQTMVLCLWWHREREFSVVVINFWTPLATSLCCVRFRPSFGLPYHKIYSALSIRPSTEHSVQLRSAMAKRLLNVQCLKFLSMRELRHQRHSLTY